MAIVAWYLKNKIATNIILILHTHTHVYIHIFFSYCYCTKLPQMRGLEQHIIHYLPVWNQKYGMIPPWAEIKALAAPFFLEVLYFHTFATFHGRLHSFLGSGTFPPCSEPVLHHPDLFLATHLLLSHFFFPFPSFKYCFDYIGPTQITQKSLYILGWAERPPSFHPHI